MIESIGNIIQLITTGLCTGIAAHRGFLLRKRAWHMLALASGVFFLGDLYWQLYQVFYGRTPRYSYIPYLSWYASYLFLLLLLIEIRDGHKSIRHGRILWIIPVFAIGMGIFYLQWGNWIGNIMTAILIGLLMWNATDGLLSACEKSEKCSEHRNDKKWMHFSILAFCLIEYALWTSSCFWSGQVWYNPYFWFDGLLSSIFLLFPIALRRAVDG